MMVPSCAIPASGAASCPRSISRCANRVDSSVTPSPSPQVHPPKSIRRSSDGYETTVEPAAARGGTARTIQRGKAVFGFWNDARFDKRGVERDGIVPVRQQEPGIGMPIGGRERWTKRATPIGLPSFWRMWYRLSHDLDQRDIHACLGHDDGNCDDGAFLRGSSERWPSPVV